MYQLQPSPFWESHTALPNWGHMGRSCPLLTPPHPQERPWNKLKYWSVKVRPRQLWSSLRFSSH